MSKYYKAEDIQELIVACMWRMTLAKERDGEGFVEYDKQIIDVGELRKRLSELSTIEVMEYPQVDGITPTVITPEVSEEDELKFYYVDSIDDYWIGQRLDNFYYAKWDSKLGFVWSASRYLPWGEHIIDENTLWKEHTYPSEPREIPFTEWIVGFIKKRISEDATSNGYWAVKPGRKGEFRCSKCGKIIYADCSSERNYCPNCGRKNKINYLLNWDDMPLKEKSDD